MDKETRDKLIKQLLESVTGATEEIVQKALEDNDWDYDKALASLKKKPETKDSSKDFAELKSVIDSIKSKVDKLDGIGEKTQYLDKLRKIFSDGDGGLSQLERLEALEKELNSLRAKANELDKFFQERLDQVLEQLDENERALVPENGSPRQKLEWVEKYIAIHKKNDRDDQDQKNNKDLNFGNEKPIPESVKKLKYEDLLKNSAKMKEIMEKYPKFYNQIKEEYFREKIK
jgi:hypothetical protein